MEIGAVRQVTWSNALVTKIYSRRARIGLLGFERREFPFSTDFAAAGFDIAEDGPDVLLADASCTPQEIAAETRAGMLVVIDAAGPIEPLESLLGCAGLQPGRDVFLCQTIPGNPLIVRGATPECAKLGCALYLQVAASVNPSVRHRIDDVVDPDSHPQR